MQRFLTVYGPQVRSTFVIALPVILGQLGHILVGLSDVAMIGRGLGEQHLSAASIANSQFWLIASLGFGLCIGISPLVAQARGAGDEKSVQALLPQSVWVAIATALLVIGAIVALSFLLPYLGLKDKEAIPLAGPFMRILALSYLPLMIFLAFRHFIDGFGVTLPGMAIMYLIVVVNILFNWILIYGKWGFPEMGINGSAWATVIARIVGLAAVLIYMAASKRFRPYLFGFFRHAAKFEYIRAVLRMGVPTGLMLFFESAAFSIAVVLMAQLGNTEVSAHQIAILMAAFTYMSYLGVSSAASVRLGNAWGAKDYAGVRTAGYASLLLAAIFIVFNSGLLFALRGVLPPLFIRPEDGPGVVPLATDLILIGCVFQVFDGIQAVCQGALRGISDTTVPTVIAVCAYLVLGLPLGYVLGFYAGLGAPGIWYGLTLGLLLSALFLLLRFMKKAAVMKQHAASLPD